MLEFSGKVKKWLKTLDGETRQKFIDFAIAGVNAESFYLIDCKNWTVEQAESILKNQIS